ncbi:hypothetical protein L1D14_07430 [Vibrio tubiashii]|uniref:hypothetical protein n=1 Tax=Vibrio tubiashii TaxID=29498 RepID=UPI001EFCDB97|nr:hypothetical protein [Vibrio tubiashii]MCG9576069.1 hypothetical protein [Vibrio tubiashii]
MKISKEKFKGYAYRAKVLEVNDESANYDGVTHTIVDAPLEIQIETINCTSKEFARRFFAVYGHGELRGDDVLLLYFDSCPVDVGEELVIDSGVAFNAILENMIDDARVELDQLTMRLTNRLGIEPVRPEPTFPLFEFDGELLPF